MNEEAGYKATWDTRITYLFCGKGGQHYRIIIYMLNGNKVRFMMGHTESILDVVQSHARQRWEELTQEGYFLKDIETASNPAKSSWTEQVDITRENLDYALDA
jgi:hypothetical protein